MSLSYDPNDEGTTHINVYSRSKTELGKLCSNFAHTPFVHPTLGTFASMEGFYYYVSTGEKFETLRECVGFTAKQVGKTLPRASRSDFEDVLLEGLGAKYHYHQELFNTLFLSAVNENNETLPLVHYYVYGTVNEKVVVPKGSSWLVDGWTSIRQQFLDSQIL